MKLLYVDEEDKQIGPSLPYNGWEEDYIPGTTKEVKGKLMEIKSIRIEAHYIIITVMKPTEPPMPKLSKFEKVRRYFNSKRIGQVITRKQFLAAVAEPDHPKWKEYKEDQYRKALELRGYLERHGTGKYKVLHFIPQMTWSWLHKDLYPNQYKKEIPY